MNLLCTIQNESDKRMRTNCIYFNEEIVMNRSENVSILFNIMRRSVHIIKARTTISNVLASRNLMIRYNEIEKDIVLVVRCEI